MNIDWYGNDGRCNPLPGTVATATCGACGSPMNVTRNVLGPTGLAEAMSGNKHLHDQFNCPNKTEGWHKKIVRLKMRVYMAEIHEDPHFKELKKKAKKEILKIFRANGIQ